MSKVRLVGRASFFKGKTIFEIAANLRNVEGRVVARKKHFRYPEKCFTILKEVTPDLSEGVRKGTATGLVVFRGVPYGRLSKIGAGQKSDWLLIPKHEEEEFCKLDKVHLGTERSSENVRAPPIFELLMKREYQKIGQPFEGPLHIPAPKKRNCPYKGSTPMNMTTESVISES